jgi:hypothetical protein
VAYCNIFLAGVDILNINYTNYLVAYAVVPPEYTLYIKVSEAEAYQPAVILQVLALLNWAKWSNLSTSLGCCSANNIPSYDTNHNDLFSNIGNIRP